jgi:hypothetical protein
MLCEKCLGKEKSAVVDVTLGWAVTARAGIDGKWLGGIGRLETCKRFVRRSARGCVGLATGGSSLASVDGPCWVAGLPSGSTDSCKAAGIVLR